MHKIYIPPAYLLKAECTYTGKEREHLQTQKIERRRDISPQDIIK